MSNRFIGIGQQQLPLNWNNINGAPFAVVSPNGPYTGITPYGTPTAGSFGPDTPDTISDGIIEACKSIQSTGGTVFFAPGLYTTEEPIIPYPGTLLKGACPLPKGGVATPAAVSVIKAASNFSSPYSKSAVIYSNPPYNELINCINIMDLVIDADSLPGVDAVNVDNVGRCIIRGCSLTKASNGLTMGFEGVNPPLAALVPGFLFMSDSTVSAVTNNGIELDYVTQIWIHDLDIVGGGNALNGIKVFDSNKSRIHDVEITSCIDAGIYFTDDDNPQNHSHLIHDNYFGDRNVAGPFTYGILDDSNLKQTLIHHNDFTNASVTKSYVAFTNPTTAWMSNHVYNNPGFDPVGVVANYSSAGAIISPFGNAAGLASGTTYTIAICKAYLTVSGGTVSNILINDPNGNTVLNGVTSCVRQPLPVGYTYTITWSGKPTALLEFD